MRESEIAHQVQIYLLRTGFMVIKTDAARRYLPGKSQGGRALPPGFPDLLALTPLLPGSKLFVGTLVECKTPTGELRASQIAFGRELDSWTIPHHLVRSLEDAERLELNLEARWVRRVLKESQAVQKGLL